MTSTYIDHHFGPEIGKPFAAIRHSWRQFTFRRLEWLYGLDRAWAIQSGKDPATQTDLQRWNNLGGRKDAA